MRSPRLALLAAALAVAASGALAADVGLSVSIGEPGFYGRIDIGRFPRPAVVHAEPIIVHRVPGAFAGPPQYLRVPPGHAKNWSKHCARYGACSQPVHFVRENWYSEVVAGGGRGGGADRGRGADRGNDRSYDRGPGRGHGRGGPRD